MRIDEHTWTHNSTNAQRLHLGAQHTQQQVQQTNNILHVPTTHHISYSHPLILCYALSEKFTPF